GIVKSCWKPWPARRRHVAASIRELQSALCLTNTLTQRRLPSENGRTINWLDTILRFWPRVVVGFHFLAALLASIHALLNKRDSRAATLWLGTIWFLLVLG